jgi:hypothetical protein
MFNDHLHDGKNRTQSRLEDARRLQALKLQDPIEYGSHVPRANALVISGVKGGYNYANDAIHHPRTSIIVKSYIGLTFTPVLFTYLAPTLPYALALDTYLDSVPTGGKWPEWR